MATKKALALYTGVIKEVQAGDDVASPAAHATQHYPAGADPVNAFAYHGFVNRTDSTMSFNSTNRTFTIAGTFVYYYQGNKIIVSTSPTVQITNTTGLWYIYFAANGTLTASQSFPSFATTVIMAFVWWNGSFGTLYDERHGYQRNIDWHNWAHQTIGARYGAGLALTTAGSGGTATFQIASGNIWDEDINFVIAQQTTARCWYQTGASTYTFDTTAITTPFRWSGALVQFVDSTNAYALTVCANNRFVNVWVYGANNLTTPIKMFVETIAGSAGYTSVANARIANPPSLLSMGLSPEMKLLYRIVVRGDGVIQTAVAADDYRSVSSLPGGGTSAISAAAVTLTPVDNVTSTNVQSGIAELDAKKASISQAFVAAIAVGRP